MTENSMLAIAAVSASASWLTWKIVARAFAYRAAQATAARKQQTKETP